MKKFVLGFAAGTAISGTVALAAVYNAYPATFKVIVNGDEFVSDPPAVVIDGSTYLPLRAIGNALGVPVNWNETLRRAEVGIISDNQNANTVLTFQTVDENPTKEQMDITETIFKSRLTNLGYTDAVISKNDTNQITVELSSADDIDKIVNLLGSPAKLTFQDADGNIILDGASDIKSAEYQFDQLSAESESETYVQLTLTQSAVQKFAAATRKVSAEQSGRNYISIVMDDSVISAPTVNHEINSGTCIISGNFTLESAKKLANLINCGSLPVDLALISKTTK